MACISALSRSSNIGQKDTPWTGTTFSVGTMQKSPVIGAADHLYNNSIGQCAETRCICSAQITPPARTLLDVSTRFYP